MKLTRQDYSRLLTTFRGGNPLWEMESMRRCMDAGMLDQYGGLLTRVGGEKIAVLNDAVERLKLGVPLGDRICDRAEDCMDEEWWTFNTNRTSGVESKIATYNASVVVFGRDTGLERVVTKRKYPFVDAVSDTVRAVENSTIRKWERVEPYAVQIDSLDGMELICFRETRSKIKVRHRIQSRYYDLFNRCSPYATWWVQLPRYRNKSSLCSDVLTVRVNQSAAKQALYIMGIIRPVVLDVPFPEV